MSRSAIPGNKNRFIKAWDRYVFIHSKRNLIKNYKNNKKSKLENIEDIEILSYKKGMSVKMIKLSNKSLAVDTKI